MTNNDIRSFDITQNNPSWLTIVRNINFNYQDYDESIPHQHKFYEFLLFEKGKGTHVIDDKSYELKDKSIHFISPNHVHQLKISEDTKGIVCMFKKGLFSLTKEDQQFLNQMEQFSNWNESPVLQTSGKDFNELKSLLNLLMDEYNQDQAHRNHLIYLLLKTFLIRASRLNHISNKKKTLKMSSHLERFFELIETFYPEQKSVQFYSNQLNITNTYLNKLTNESLGKSASQCINDRIILEAKRRLNYSSKIVKEVAYDLGFDDPSYFSRYFKKHTTYTPLQYKKTNKTGLSYHC